MKKVIACFGMILIAASTYAQDLHCATDRVMETIYTRDPELRLRKLQQDQKTQSKQQKPASSSATYVIPVVFHILHLDGPENISDEQVKDAVRILNRDFAKKNPDTTDIIPAFKNLADSMKIQFVLATKDPLGNCTNGIKHYYDADTDWDENSPTLYSHTWDPTRYMNVYVVRKIIFNSGFGAAGYTYFPGTWPLGDQHDAIVVLNNYFGSIGTGSNFLSRVLTHEVGHWLDLYHVFGATNGAGVDCSGDDFVNDTPPTPGYLNCPNPAAPSQYQICSAGISENFQNYMDYSYCCRMFTPGQAQRMQMALQNPISGRDNLVSPANLIATGVVNPNGDCVPIADFKYSRTKTCVGTAVTFTDASWNGQPTSYSWTFSGGTPSTSNASVVTVVYNLPGSYSVIHSSANQAGSSSPMSKNNIIQVVANSAQYATPWSEGFENLSQLNSNWITYGSSGATRWEQSGEAAYTGMYSAKLDATDNTRKSTTALISPLLNLSTMSSPNLSFRLAAAEVTPNHINNLKVYCSVNCGDTWTVIYDKTGQNLVTTGSSAPNFIPTKNEWRQEFISLSAFASATLASFKFEYTRDTIPAANNVFIDDIQISSATAINETAEDAVMLNVYPVPTHGSFTVQFFQKTKAAVHLQVCDVLGRVVKDMELGETMPGAYQQTFVLDDSCPDGLYFVRLRSGDREVTKKIILSR